MELKRKRWSRNPVERGWGIWYQADVIAKSVHGREQHGARRRRSHWSGGEFEDAGVDGPGTSASWYCLRRGTREGVDDLTVDPDRPARLEEEMCKTRRGDGWKMLIPVVALDISEVDCVLSVLVFHLANVARDNRFQSASSY